MRRARLKVQATVPIRRKALQENVKTEEAPPVDAEKSSENCAPNAEKSSENHAVATEKSVENPVVTTEKSEENFVKTTEKSPENPVPATEKSSATLENKSNKTESETEKSTVSTVQTEKEPIDKLPSPTNETKNVKQEILQNSQGNKSDKVNEEQNNSVIIENADISETNNLQTDANTNKQADVEANKNDNINKNCMEAEAEEASHAEVNPPKHVSSRSCFMRPVPRLDSGGRVRKNSVQGSGASASESEDDCKKSSTPARVRNDSICSVQSNKEGSSNTGNFSKLKLGHQKRRLTVSESAKKLADARKEFMIKHENKAPDRSKLTMYDLIYYNPVTNPMTRSENSTPTRKLSVCSTVADESKENEEEEDEPAAMPVPRVKVGPDGQLIVDEKSLIIERTELKNRSGPIVHDENNGGGFYKRRQKSKDWTKWDTLKFYKALSNIGTDFLLMQNFFPQRTRQELKLKFKKEERTNRRLVEQALKTQEFDMETLKEEMDTLAENEKSEIEALKAKAESKKQSKSKRVSKCRFVVGSIEEIDNSCEEDIDDDLSSGESRNEDSQKKLRKSTRRKRKTSISAIYDLENKSSSDADDAEIYNVKPTRSGRLPKRRKLQAPNVKASDSSDQDEEPPAQEPEAASAEPERVDSHPQDVIANMIPNMKDVEPGSLVILTRESPGEPGKTVVQVYMVSKNYNANDPNSEQNMTPVNLSPELLATVNSKISEAEPVHVHSKGSAVNADSKISTPKVNSDITKDQANSETPGAELDCKTEEKKEEGKCKNSVVDDSMISLPLVQSKVTNNIK